MKKYELSLSRNYVSSWGIEEAIRELLQNAKDSRDKIDDAWYEYEYSDYKDFKEWFDKYGNQLNDSAKDEFKELINRLEPTGFDLICNEVWK